MRHAVRGGVCGARTSRARKTRVGTAHCPMGKAQQAWGWQRAKVWGWTDAHLVLTFVMVLAGVFPMSGSSATAVVKENACGVVDAPAQHDSVSSLRLAIVIDGGNRMMVK